MTPLAISWSCALALVLAPARVQQDDAIQKIEIRVTTTTPGSVIIDRGSTDGLMRGDRVVLRPKEGEVYEGFIDEPLERIARVELADSSVSVAAGTRGDVLIPKARANRKGAREQPREPKIDKPATPTQKKRSSTTKAPKVPAADPNAAPAQPAAKKGEAAKPASKPGATKPKTADPGAAAGTANPTAANPAPAKPAATKAPKPKPASKPVAGTGADAKSGTAKPTSSRSVKAPTVPPGDEKPAASGNPPSAKPATSSKPTSTGSATTRTTAGETTKGASSAKPAASGSKPAAGSAKAPVASTKKPVAAGGSSQGTPPKTSTSGAKPAAGAAKKPAAGKAAAVPEHSPWKAQEEEFSKDKPLLSLLKPLRPEQRSTRLTGSIWAAANVVDYDDVKGNDNYARVGTVLDLENPFNEGGALHLDTEVDYRDERDSGSGTDLLTRRLSYSRGGNRFSPTRWEFGRFLQYGMPEFQWCDGVEWQQRTDGGDRFGASVGFMPEPDDDFKAFEDFQFSAYYLWSNDESERFTLGAGFQQTWDDGGVDRDLIVAKARFLPGDGWDFHCANWIDIYGAGDNVKDVPYGLTQAVWSLSRHYPSDSWWDLTYRKVSFPDIDDDGQFTPWTKAEIDHNRLHKVMLSGSNWWTKSTRIHGRAGGWVDEEETGGTAEAGVEFDGPFIEDARLDLTGFGTLGEFTSLVGGRISYGAFVENGRWDLFYEISNNHEDGFQTDIQDIPQHRIYATRSFYFSSGWTMSATAGALVLDGNFGWNVGFFVQKSF